MFSEHTIFITEFHPCVLNSWSRPPLCCCSDLKYEGNHSRPPAPWVKLVSSHFVSLFWALFSPWEPLLNCQHPRGSKRRNENGESARAMKRSSWISKTILFWAFPILHFWNFIKKNQNLAHTSCCMSPFLKCVNVQFLWHKVYQPCLQCHLKHLHCRILKLSFCASHDFCIHWSSSKRMFKMVVILQVVFSCVIINSIEIVFP